jgi:hypothetical protein
MESQLNDSKGSERSRGPRMDKLPQTNMVA